MNIFPISFIQRQIPVQLPTTGSISTPYNQLNTIATYLRNYVSDFRNPQFFVYRLDGTAFQITDGGNDMFDGGNSTVPYLRSNVTYWNPGSSALATAPAVSYAVTSSTLTDTNFGYVSLGYTQSAGTFPASQSSIYHPLTMLGARSGSGPIGWQKTGNIGADGRGSILTGSLYNGDVYMLLGHPNWNSNYGSIIWSASMSTAGQGGILYATGSASNLLAVTALLSRTGSTPAGASLPISASDLQTVVTNYTLRIKEAIGY